MTNPVGTEWFISAANYPVPETLERLEALVKAKAWRYFAALIIVATLKKSGLR